MSKRYRIGVNRNVTVKTQDGELYVTISEDKSVKSVTFPAKRWAQFVAIMNRVDEGLEQLISKQRVNFSYHVGGAWYVSVTTGFQCVDIRKWYYNTSINDVKPTKTGIALRLREWGALKEIIRQIHQKHPLLTTTPTYSSQADHYNLDGALACTECHPFRMHELLFSMDS